MSLEKMEDLRYLLRGPARHCRAPHPLVPHVRCKRKPGHRGRHIAPDPFVSKAPRLRWER